jgi:ferredoxin
VPAFSNFFSEPYASRTTVCHASEMAGFPLSSSCGINSICAVLMGTSGLSDAETDDWSTGLNQAAIDVAPIT